MGLTCVELRNQAQNTEDLWRGLCRFLLGDTSLLMHERAWAVAPDKGTAAFYRRLFQAIWSCEHFCYDHDCRRQVLDSLGHGEKNSQDLFSMSGHTAEAIGPLVVQIGGMRNAARDNVVKLTVINLSTNSVCEPRLVEDSCQPEQRMRHSSCVVTAPFLPSAAFPETVLVLGGHDGDMRSMSCGTPREAVRRLLFLQFTREDGSEVRWQECLASGTAPNCIYNHACASFQGGRRVCVFGGDIPVCEPEFARINDRRCAFVYVLDVPGQQWEVVATSGPGPAWRSFHAAVAHTSLADGLEYFVTFGGTEDHCQPLSGGNLVSMRGYQLCLGDFKWRRGPEGGFQPGPRMRFGVARWGRHLLIHGGHGQTSPHPDAYVARLNLSTLRWSPLVFSNVPVPLPANAFETGSPTAGCVVGGAQQALFGPRMLSRLVIFRLRDPLAHGEAQVHEHDGTPATTRSLLPAGLREEHGTDATFQALLLLMGLEEEL